MITSPNGNRLVKCFKRSVIILIHPLCLLFIFCMIDTIRAFPEKSVLSILSATISGIYFSFINIFHSALKLEKSAISKVQKSIICIFKNGKKSIFAPEKSLKLPKMQFLD